MKKLKLVALTLAMLTVVGLAGCTQQTPTNEATQTQTLPKKDRAGKDIHLSEKNNKNCIPCSINDTSNYRYWTRS